MHREIIVLYKVLHCKVQLPSNLLRGLLVIGAYKLMILSWLFPMLVLTFCNIYTGLEF